MILGLPSGIGDISWVISKVVNSDEWKNHKVGFQIADGWPFRAKPYLDMIGVESSYGQFRYEDIITFELLHPYKTWKDVCQSCFGTYLMEPNMHLEEGRPLSTYLPDLPTDYHYPLNIPDISSKPYYKALTSDSYIGISAASYRGASAWKTWEMEQWIALCHMVLPKYKICLMGGSWDDLTRSLESELPEDSVLNLVGRTSFPEACAVHKLLPFYIGFSSGLGIIRSVMSLPTFMLWPEHQQPLSTSWADPADIESSRYIAFPYVQPKTIHRLFKQQEEQHGK